MYTPACISYISKALNISAMSRLLLPLYISRFSTNPKEGPVIYSVLTLHLNFSNFDVIFHCLFYIFKVIVLISFPLSHLDNVNLVLVIDWQLGVILFISAHTPRAQNSLMVSCFTGSYDLNATPIINFYLKRVLLQSYSSLKCSDYH